MIAHDLPFEAYSALPGWSWSLIKLLHDGSPLHVHHARENPREDTADLAMLRAIHALVLEPDTFGDRFVLFDGRRAGRAFEDFVEEHPGAAVLNAREWDTTFATANAVLAHPVARKLLEAGRPEVSVTWTDGDSGLPCKGRIDWLGPNALVDLKTLGTTNEDRVGRDVARRLYHGQLAHYDAGLRTHGIEVPAYLIVAEGAGAHDVAVFEVDAGVPDGALHVGRHIRRELLKRLAECVRLNHWPGRHPTAAPSLCLPPYALIEDEFTFGENADNDEVL